MGNDLERRRSLLLAALGFLQLRQEPPDVAPLRRWLDSWTGLGAVVTGLLRQGYDVDLLSIGPERWQATFLHANPVGGAPIVVGYAEETRPAAAVHQAAWRALMGLRAGADSPSQSR